MKPCMDFTLSSLILFVNLQDLCTAQQNSQLRFSTASSSLKLTSSNGTSSLHLTLTTPTASPFSPGVSTAPTETLRNNTNQYNPLAQEQITCYPLPYGAIGSAGHVLNCYTIAMFALGRSPLVPWTRIQKDISR